ncbi:MAG: ArsR family transcriptional regulator [Geobacteraceae bacterium]|nr:ArsR family transcriptional regulator [Geobacteraceae bacterium]
MTTYRRIDAITKTTQIIDYLATVKAEAATGPQIAQAINMSVGTVMCHLATLEDAGYVTAVGGGYRLGMKLALHWARVKSNLEGQRDRIGRDLESISIPGGN